MEEQTSALSKADFQQGKHTKKTRLLGIKMPDGQVFMCVTETTSRTVLEKFAHAVQGELVYIQGEWRFEPHD